VIRSPENILSKIFGSRANAAIAALAKTPSVQALMDQVDQEQVERRSALIERLRTLPEKHEKACIEANRREQAANAEVVKARAALEAAKQRHMEAMQAAMSLSLLQDKERGELLKELESTSDPRVVSFLTSLMYLRMDVRAVEPDIGFTQQGEKFRLAYDVSRITKALEAIGAADARAREMLRLPLTHGEVTMRLQKVCAELAGPLAALPTPLQPPKVASDESELAQVGTQIFGLVPFTPAI
jgi:hypothetical protein